jgi:hypothetical protein
MASIKDISKSLISAVSEVVSKSSETRTKLKKTLFSEALKKFKVSSASELSEQDKKAFYAYVQNQLTEADCSCDSMDEDDMPGDEVYHTAGDEDAKKKKELGENEDEEDSSVEATDAEEKDDLEERCWDGYKPTPGVKAYEKGSCVKEGADPDELATNGALGVTDASKQLPVHADVLRDSSPVDGTTEYRLFAQFNTNTLPQIVPPVVLPGAPTVDALRDIVEGLPWFCDVCERALADASDSPHQKVADETTEDITEAAVVTDLDKKTISLIRRSVQNAKVGVIKNNVSYSLEVEQDSAKLTVTLEPSPKAPGKLAWAVHDNSGVREPVYSAIFVQGDERTSLLKLQSLLSDIARRVPTKYYNPEYNAHSTR